MSNPKKTCASDSYETQCATNLKKIKDVWTASPRSITFEDLCSNYFEIAASSYRNYVHVTGKQCGRISEYAATKIANVTLLDYDKIIGKASLDKNDIKILESSFQRLENNTASKVKINNVFAISDIQLEELVERIAERVVEKLKGLPN